MLEKPIELGSMQLNHRLVMAPVDLEISDSGTVSQKQLEFYDSRTQGGSIGLVIVEHSFVRADGRAAPNQLSCAKDEDIAGLSKIAETIHRNGSKVVLQLAHAGLKSVDMGDGLAGISPSGAVDVVDSTMYRTTHAMSQDEIDELLDAYRAAAQRSMQAGFDGVEIHAAHGYLLNQFYSPLANHRTDAYGAQSIQNRIRLHLQLITALREVLSADKLLGIRFGACDYMDGGSTIADGVAVSTLLEQSGVDFIDVSGGMCGSRPDFLSGLGYFADASSAIKSNVSVPVLVAGGVMSRQDAELLLEQGAADLIGVARSIIADPSWARSAMG